MILAMNYHLVAPTGLYELAAAVRAVEDLGSLVTFELVSNGDGSVSIVLSNRASTLKGVRIVVAVEDGVLDRIERGSLFAGASELFFGLVPGDRNTVDISAAALGVDRPFARSGEVARLVIRNEGEALPRVRIAAIDLRDLDNTKTEIEVVEEYETPYVPQATALLQNFPNPFNPVTTITFDLTEAAHVRIDVFDVSGRLLATPVDAAKGAGRHRVEWNGRDTGGSLVPSGIYFYRMKTAGFDATRKMILVR